MSRATRSRDAAHFERLYAADDDPWLFRSSGYERVKYAATIAALPARRFAACLEVGCSIGELTWRLAHRCDMVHGIDIAAAPLAAARVRCAGMAQVRFSNMRVPDEWPVATYDLIVLSEILYFLTREDIVRVALRVLDTLAENGVVLLVNWLGATDDPTAGDLAAEIFIESVPELHVAFGQRCEFYRLDRLQSAGKKMFFFEEKNQKTFALALLRHPRRCSGGRGADRGP